MSSPRYSIFFGSKLPYLRLFFVNLRHTGWSPAGGFGKRRGGGAWKKRDGRQALPFEEKKGISQMNEMMEWNEWGWNVTMEEEERMIMVKEGWGANS